MITEILGNYKNNVEEYEGKLADGRMFAVQNRYGHTSVCVSSAPTHSISHARRGIEIFSAKHPEDFYWGITLIETIVEQAVEDWDRVTQKSDCLVYA